MYVPRMDEVTLSYIAFVLAAIPIFCYGLVVLFYMASLFYNYFRLHKKQDPASVYDELPGVSILKPLMGTDPLLESNLESHFTLNYPKFELLLCVQDDQDPVINLVNQLRERHPKVDCTLFVGGKEGILNPMVQNMAPGYEAAKYDIVWVSTSRIFATTDILRDMVARLKNPKVTLVHQMPFTMDRPGLAAAVEKVYFGCNVARNYLTINMIGLPCFTGMSYLVRKPELDDLNGLAWFGRFLAEDFFIAKLLYDKGFQQKVAAVPAQQNVYTTSIAGYKDRMVRWLRLRMNMMPFTSGLLEPLSESIPLGVWTSWAVYYFFNFSPYTFFLIHMLAFCSLDYIQLRGIQRVHLNLSIFMFVVAWVIRELLVIFIYFEALLNVQRIKWGKRTYKMTNFGESLELASNREILPI